MNTPNDTFDKAQIFNPDQPRNELLPGIPMSAYRQLPGLAPSDLKLASPDYKKDGSRGHPLRLAEHLRNQQTVAAGGAPLPGFKEDTGNKTTDMGSLYHMLLLTPGEFHKEFAVVTPELQEDLLTTARDRKMQDAPQEFSMRLKEGQEFKKREGRVPDQHEQEQLLAEAQARHLGKIEWHSQLTEFQEWKNEQKKAGKTVIFPYDLVLAEAMVEALSTCPANAQTRDELQMLIPKDPERSEVSMFATWEFSHDPHTVIQLKGRPDVLATGDTVFDPKTAMSCHPDDFNWPLWDWGYDFSMGAYVEISYRLAEMLSAEEARKWGLPKRNVAFLAQEKNPPFFAKIWWLPRDWLNSARFRWRLTLRNVLRCYESGDWSTPIDWEYQSEYPSAGRNEILPPYKYQPIIEAQQSGIPMEEEEVF